MVSNLPHSLNFTKNSSLFIHGRRSPKKHQSIVPVARLFGPAIFEASKLQVLFLGVDEKKHPGKLPRTYTLTHSDITSKLTLAISQSINNSQLQGWYNKFQRDEVVAEWKKVQEKMSLHVHCHINGGHFLLDLCARLRFFIFSKELPVVLKAFIHGDGNLFNNYPELEKALVWVYFHSNIPEYNKVECWGPLKNAAAPSKVSSCRSYKDKGDETPSISSWNTPSLPSSLPPATHSPAKYPTPFLVSLNPLSPSTRLSSFSSRKSCRGVVAMAGSGKFFVGGNWKCNGTKESISKLVSDLNSAKLEPDVDVVVAPPFVYVDLVKNSLTDRIEISAQTSWIGKGGAFTGEIRVEQLQDIGCKWVILGHSERRHVIGEDDQFIGKKAAYALSQGLSVIDEKEREMVSVHVYCVCMCLCLLGVS
ncbi:protein STAY-GREEN 1, chloroplastic-like [Camellia sinensis]|uniref:protein STAY-GREEN 1, chloroplastic-like n=1 Tax=Camellia sinensis TaxID=4442 RepID=UPI00103636FF|nr:protein STAY-GREEN 1, chloroplastic-like [Camellia sinensis]